MKRRILTLAVHTMDNRENVPFDKDAYSRFKYGSKSVARKFGKEIGSQLADKLLPTLKPTDQIVIAPSPYMFIPTAAFALKDYVISYLNRVLIKAGMKVMQETKVYRQTGYTSEYGSMTASERKSVIGSENFHTDKEFLKDKIVLFLDDIKITGAHQERMEEMICRLKLSQYYKQAVFVYYASLNDPTSDPTIEDHLNFYSMKSLLDLDKIIKNDEFIFNTRNVKYILNSPHVDCVNFLEYQTERFRQSLFHEAVGNSYHLEPNFSMNFKYLEYLVTK